MRMLLDNPAAASPTVYRRFFRRALFRGLTAGVATGSVSPYLSLNALVLDDAEVDSLAELTSRFARIFAIAGRCVAEDTDTLVAFGFPWSFAELLSEEPPRPIVFGRFDFFLDCAGRWQLLEYNSDTPSGIREGTAVDEAAFALLSPRFHVDRINDPLAPSLAAAFREALPGDGRPIRLGFLTEAGHLEDMGQTLYTERLIRAALAAEGVDTVLGDIDNLGWTRDRRVALVGQPIDALYRYYPFEAMLALPQFWMIAEAIASGRLLLLNGLRGLLLQNKGLLAWIWSHREDPMFSAEEQAAIKQHLPPTWWTREVPADFDRRKAVVKQVFGREGEEVYFGDAMSDEDWARCQQWGTFIAQVRVETPPLAAVTWDLQGRPEARTRWATVGSFVAAERWAGLYTRLGDHIVTAQAEFVPTFRSRR